MVLVVSEKQGPHGLLVVVTDKEILGKTFEEGKVHLDLTADFYKGEERPKEEVKELVRKGRDLHFTGREAVAIAIEMDLISADSILWVDGCPHAVVVMSD